MLCLGGLGFDRHSDPASPAPRGLGLRLVTAAASDSPAEPESLRSWARGTSSTWAVTPRLSRSLPIRVTGRLIGNLNARAAMPPMGQLEWPPAPARAGAAAASRRWSNPPAGPVGPGTVTDSDANLPVSNGASRRGTSSVMTRDFTVTGKFKVELEVTLLKMAHWQLDSSRCHSVTSSWHLSRHRDRGQQNLPKVPLT
eukprot:55855-Rhodomonas_salina.1